MQPLAAQLHVAPSAQVIVHPPPAQLSMLHVSPARHSTLHPPPAQSPITRVEGVVSSVWSQPTWQEPSVHASMWQLLPAEHASEQPSWQLSMAQLAARHSITQPPLQVGRWHVVPGPQSM